MGLLVGDAEDKNGWRTWCAIPALRALQKTVPGGNCLFCERAVRQSQTREMFICWRADCRTEYNTEYVRWRREEKVKLGFTQRGGKPKVSRQRWKQFYDRKP